MQLRLNQAKERLTDIDLKLEDPDVVKDLDAFRKLSKEKANLDPIIEKYDEYLKLVSDREDALLMLKDSDEEIIKFAKETIDNIDKELIDIEEQLKILLVPKDPNDDKNIVVEIRGAVGGDEANIFAGDLFRMYVKYAEKKGWKLQLIDESPSGVGGYSLVSFMIKGEGVYSRLKFESGAHRVQRVPKTEANGRIHTSTATVLVMPEAEEIDITISNADLHVDTYRSQGAGGRRSQGRRRSGSLPIVYGVHGAFEHHARINNAEHGPHVPARAVDINFDRVIAFFVQGQKPLHNVVGHSLHKFPVNPNLSHFFHLAIICPSGPIISALTKEELVRQKSKRARARALQSPVHFMRLPLSCTPSTLYIKIPPLWAPTGQSYPALAALRPRVSKSAPACCGSRSGAAG